MSRLPLTGAECAAKVGTVKFYGNAGDDYFQNNTSIVCIAFGGAGNDFLTGGTAADQLYGEAGSDLLNGGRGDDYIYGGDGPDRIYGNAGNDTLDGGSGNDGLFGGTGRDDLLGGTGADRFLVWDQGTVNFSDTHSEDAVIKFVTGDVAWSENEIVAADVGLYWLNVPHK